MEELIPQTIRACSSPAAYGFAKAAIMIGFVIGGLVLDRTAGRPAAIAAFAFLFAAAAASRFTSSCYLAHSRTLSQRDCPNPRPD